MAAQLTLQPEPSAAGIARRWVKQELTDRERADLLESAVLGVSELVTNALLHVRGMISVRIVDSETRLRIEVYDVSSRPPQARPTVLVAHGTNPPTIGRGLQIVDSISLSWGVAYEDAGKCVWFQPRPEGSALLGDEPELPARTAPTPRQRPVNETVVVELVDVPVDLLVHYRTRFHDLRRELTLITLDEGDTASVGDRLNALAHGLESFRRIGAEADKAIDEATAAGKDRATLRYDLPLAAVPSIVELQKLLVEANAFCRAQQLLTLAAGPQETAMRAWYLGELVDQARGAAPTPWPGAFVVTDPDPLH